MPRPLPEALAAFQAAAHTAKTHPFVPGPLAAAVGEMVDFAESVGQALAELQAAQPVAAPAAAAVLPGSVKLRVLAGLVDGPGGMRLPGAALQVSADDGATWQDVPVVTDGAFMQALEPDTPAQPTDPAA